MQKDVATRTLDRIDLAILRYLQADGRLSNKEIADKVNLSPTPCLRRIRQLEDSGHIVRFKAVLDRKQLEFGVHAFLGIKRNRDSDRADISEQIIGMPEVLSCHVVSGEFDLWVELVAKDMDDYARIAIETIAEIPGVYDIRSTFSIRSLKSDGNLPI
jgi:Lrp/AsnC family leucine-responsive transcriptional regulator